MSRTTYLSEEEFLAGLEVIDDGLNVEVDGNHAQIRMRVTGMVSAKFQHARIVREWEASPLTTRLLGMICCEIGEIVKADRDAPAGGPLPVLPRRWQYMA